MAKPLELFKAFDSGMTANSGVQLLSAAWLLPDDFTPPEASPLLLDHRLCSELPMQLRGPSL